VPIPDNGSVTNSINANSTWGLVSDVNVRVRINHTWTGDLALLLTSPTGQSIPLMLNTGVDGDNLGSGSTDCSGTFTQFDDESSGRLDFAVAPFASSFRPVRRLATFDGSSAGGTWTLTVQDKAAQDVGTLYCWQLEVMRTTPPANEFSDDRSDLSVYRPSTSQWFIRTLDNPFSAYDTIGQSGDIPVVGQYVPGTINQRAMFRPSTGQWTFSVASGLQPFIWGINGDIPVPADYNADGVTDAAVYRPSTGVWYVRNVWNISYGTPGDIPVPASYLPGAGSQIAVWRPSTGEWFIGGIGIVVWGGNGDIPVPGNYFGDERDEVAVFRPSTGHWYMRGWDGEIRLTQYGINGDIPVPADYDGDGRTDLAVFRPSEGRWYIQNISVVDFGAPGDIPILKRPAYPGYPY